MKIFDKTFIRFIIAGLINTAAGYSVMFVLYNILKCGYWFSSAANYAAGAFISFFLNKYFTFKIREYSVFMIVAFIVVIALSYMIAYKAARIIIFAVPGNQSECIRDNIALIFGMCIYTVLNYLGQKFIVFRLRQKR